jgi:putative tryptophan/tyrosine transport system substrate-binding protein
MRRRHFIQAILWVAGCCLWTDGSVGQEQRKIYRVGLLARGAVGPNDERRRAFTAKLASRGFVEGQNLIIDIRAGDGRYERFAELAAALKTANADVIVTYGYPAALAAKNSADGVPVVVSGAGDPIATGLAEGLARPGGYVTGMTEMSTELSAKRLEILKDAVPNLKRVAMLWNASDLGMTLRYRAADTAAKQLGLVVQALGVREPNDFEEAFDAMTRTRPDAILMVSDALTMLNRKRVIEYASANRLPTIYEFSSLVREGGLMSYGPDNRVVGDRIGDLVARILLGAKPSELPLEQPSKLDFVVNLNTAKVLGLDLPPTLVARADEVIE